MQKLFIIPERNALKICNVLQLETGRKHFPVPGDFIADHGKPVLKDLLSYAYVLNHTPTNPENKFRYLSTEKVTVEATEYLNRGLSWVFASDCVSPQAFRTKDHPMLNGKNIYPTSMDLCSSPSVESICVFPGEFEIHMVLSELLEKYPEELWFIDTNSRDFLFVILYGKLTEELTSLKTKLDQVLVWG